MEQGDLSDAGLAEKRAEQAAVREHPERRGQGLVIVNTGNGKGKTTAALGVLLRAWGRNMHVVMFQFIKAATANWGETRAATRLGIEMIPMGAGFTWVSKDITKDRQLAIDGWARAKERILSGVDDIVVLDELTYLMSFGWLETGEVIETLRARPTGQHVIITGRDASAELIEFADLVTEMREIKHPYNLGIKAQPGVEF
ncbi:MAG: cob(I)yrinic acid a,c-diamide adenosyltransferase [Chloroflexi bacterium]|nr:cob(I)yrinic acid a,c-diamide adenosyltransferase [Chloroflexota bacterium]